MLSDYGKVFTKENLNLFFRDLSKEYKRLGGRNQPVEIILIGGAAVIESYGFREMTADIDAILPDLLLIKEAILRVGDLHGLPNGWLNADFMKTSSYSSALSRYSVPYKTFNQVLSVRMITGEYLIAMKLRSARQYKNDLSDIIGIVAEQKKAGKPISGEEVDTAVRQLYGGWEGFPAHALPFIRRVLAFENPEEAYERIRQSEVQNGIELSEFDEKYPCVLANANIDAVLEETIQKKRGRASLLQELQALKEKEEKQRLVQDEEKRIEEKGDGEKT